MTMKSSTIIKKIKTEGVCSEHTAELLTHALHREGKLEKDRIIRFSILQRKFDVVNADYLKTRKFNMEICTGWMEFDELMEYLKPKTQRYIVTENAQGWYEFRAEGYEGGMTVTKNQFESYIKELHEIWKREEPNTKLVFEFNFR